MPYPAQAAFFRRRNGRRVDVMEFAVAVVRRTPDAFQSFASRRPAEGGVVQYGGGRSGQYREYNQEDHRFFRRMGNIRLISTDRIRRLNCRPGRNSRIFRSGLRRIHPGNPPHDMFWRRSSSELPTPASCGNRPRKHCRDNVCRLVRKRYKRWKTDP